MRKASPSKSSKTDVIRQWRQCLTENPLPVLPHTGQALLTQVRNPNISLSELVKIIKHDPVLCLHVVKATHQLLKGDKEVNICGIAHCVSMLGLDRLHQLTHRIPVLRPDFEDEGNLNYLHAIMRSVHAAVQAQTWAHHRGHSAPEQVFLAALSYGVPQWCLWQFATKEMFIIDHLVVNERIPTPEAEQTVLGCTTLELSRSVANHWNLPRVVREAYDKNNMPDKRFMMKHARQVSPNRLASFPPFDPHGVAINSPAVQVILSNWLALESDIGWNTRQIERCFRVLATFLTMKPHQVRAMSLKAALQTSRAYPIPGILKPGARILLPARPPIRRRIGKSQLKATVIELGQRIDNQPSAAPGATFSATELLSKPLKSTAFGSAQADLPETIAAKSPEDAKPPSSGSTPKRQMDTEIIERFVERLRTPQLSFQSRTELLQSLCDTIHHGIGLSRVVVGLLGSSAAILTGQLSAGTFDKPTLRNFKVKLEHHNLFFRILNKESSIWVNLEKNANASKLVPISFKCANGGIEDFFIMSLFDGNTPIGIVYADNGPTSTPLRSLHYSAFKNVCSGTNSKLASIA